jgi:hypothetical protein
MARAGINRPTENFALAAIARQAAKLGITQGELLTRKLKKTSKLQNRKVVCTCPFCSRKRRNGDISHRVMLSFA